MKYHTKIWMTLAVVAVLVGGCRTSDRDEDTSTTAAEAHLFSEAVHHDIFKIVDAAAKNEPGIKSLTCATITADTLANPKTMAIDFGYTQCAGDDGLIRHGILDVTFSGMYSDSGTVTTITANDYHIDGWRIDGTTTITNMGVNGAGNTWYLIDVNNQHIYHRYDEWNIVWNSDRTMEWISGAATPMDVTDDIYETRGEFSGADRFSVVYVGAIETPLTNMASCNYVSGGTVALTPTNLAKRTLDYGSGCDNKATVTRGDDAWDLTVEY